MNSSHRKPGAGKQARRQRARLIGVVTCCVLLSATKLCAADLPVDALPTGEHLVDGNVVVTSSGASMEVRQTTDRAIVDWRSFSVGSGAQVGFRQPGAESAILNRVVGDAPPISEIYGSMTSNGQVFLLNPSGVVFGKGSSVQVGGLVAGTMSIGNEEFMAGSYRFTRNGSTAAVVNQGSLVASDGGLIALLGSTVKNEWVIEARLGSVILASGEAVTLSLGSDKLWSVALEPSQVAALIENRKLVQADGGRVVMQASTAGELAGMVINDGGVVQARTIGEHDGVIRLYGDMDSGLVQVGGSLDAGGATAADRGGSIDVAGSFVSMGGSVSADGATGGSIAVTARHTLSLAEQVSARGLSGRGGEVNYAAGNRITEISNSRTDASGAVDGGSITVASGYGIATSGTYSAAGGTGRGGRIDMTAPDVRLLSTTIDASGAARGGIVRIGGALQGGKAPDASQPYYNGFAGRWGSLPSLSTASQTFINSGVSIDVSSSHGAGGTAIVWSDDQTTFLGAIDARGATSGGYTEISSASTLRHAELANVKTGEGGTLLLDPKDIVIGDAAEVKSWSYAGILGAFYGGPASSGKDRSLPLDGNGDTSIFGRAIALNGDGSLLAVGGYLFDGADNTILDSGAVYLFSFDKTKPAFTDGKLEGVIGYGYSGPKSIDMSQKLNVFDYFGASLSFNSAGTLLAVGAHGDDGPNDTAPVDSGAVYLFSFGDAYTSGRYLGTVGKGYTGTGNINVTSLDASDYFGCGVSLSGDGNWLAVGAYQDDGPNHATATLETGAVHLFKLHYDQDTHAYDGGAYVGIIGDGYQSTDELIATDVPQLEGADYFGYSVALNGNGTLLAVGALNDDGFGIGTSPANNYGAVYLFGLSHNPAGDYAAGTSLGTIGYGYQQTSGTHDIDVGAPDPKLGAVNNSDTFGISVSLSYDGRLLAVGAQGDDGLHDIETNAGAVYLLKLNYDTSTGAYTGGAHVGTIGYGYLEDDANSNINIPLDKLDYFGGSVSLSADGKLLAAGTAYDCGYGNLMYNTGAVHLFSFTGTDFSDGSLVGTVGAGYLGEHSVSFSSSAGDYFGYSVSLNGNGRLMAVGAIGDDGFGNISSDTGAVYLFSFSDSFFSGGTLQSVIGKGYALGNNYDVAALDANDHFGTAVSLNSNGTLLAVGASGDDGVDNSVTDSGALYLFDLTFADGNYHLDGKPSAPRRIGSGYTIPVTLGQGDNFGCSVSLNGAGDLMAVGAFGDDGSSDTLVDSGAVHLFSKTGAGFSLVGTLGSDYGSVAPGVVERGDWFGRSVALNDSGKLLAVGATGDDGAGNDIFNSGALHLFTFSGTDFSGAQKVGTIGRDYSGLITLSTLAVGDAFGGAVSLNGDGTLLAVGAPGDDSYSNTLGYSGAVHLFSLGYTDTSGFNSPGTGYKGTLGYSYAGGKNVNVSLRPADYFGCSVSLSGDGKMLAAGAFGDDSFSSGRNNAGAVYLFSFLDDFSAGSLQATFGRGNPGPMAANLSVGLDSTDYFGKSVALNANGNLLAVGAYNDDGFGNLLKDSGAVYLFAFSGADFAGGQLRGIIGSGYSGGDNVNVSLDTQDYFGCSVALNASGTLLAVGAYGDDGVSNASTSTNSGAVHLFRFAGTDFSGGTQQAVVGSGYTVDVPLDIYDNFGVSVSLNSSGTLLAVGANGDDGAQAGFSSLNYGAVHLFNMSYDSGTGQFKGGLQAGIVGYGYTGPGDVNVPLSKYDSFGSSVALSGTGKRLAAGAMYADGDVTSPVSSSGAVYLFDLNQDAGGRHTGGYLAGTIGNGYPGSNNVDIPLDVNDFFGYSLALSRDGSRLAVGAQNDDGFGNALGQSGAVYLFDLRSNPDGTFLSGSHSGTMGYGYTTDTRRGNVNVGELNNYDAFGTSVALNNDGSLLAVGAYGDDGYGDPLAGGAVYLFRLDHDASGFAGGTHLGTIGYDYSTSNLSRSVTLDQDSFGDSVSLSGDGKLLALGAPLDDGYTGGQTDAGAVYLFSFSDSAYSGGTLQSIIGSGYSLGRNLPVTLDALDGFGSSVSLSRDGKVLAVGASGDDGLNNSASTYNNYGAVHLFGLSYDVEGKFTGVAKVGTIGSGYSGAGNISLALDADDAFGSAVSLDNTGGILAVGAPGDDGGGSTPVSNSGAVYLYNLTYDPEGIHAGSAPGIIGKGYSGAINSSISTGLEAEDAFGSAVSLTSTGGMLAVGAPGDDGGGVIPVSNSGAVYLFGLNYGGGMFTGGSKAGMIGDGYTASHGYSIGLSAGDAFGCSVALNSAGTALAVGSEMQDGGDPLRSVVVANSGAVYLFDLSYDSNALFSTSPNGVIGNGYRGARDINLAVESNDHFGSAVSFNSDGSMLAVGASGDDGLSNLLGNAGAVYLFKQGAPVSQTYSSVSDNENYDRFGHQTVTLRASEIASYLATGASLVLQANNDITLLQDSHIDVTGVTGASSGGDLAMQAGRSILLLSNSSIATLDGDLTLIANDRLSNGVLDQYRDSGPATVTMAPGSSINTGSGNVSIGLRDGQGKTYSGSSDIILQDIDANMITVLNQGPSSGSGIVLNGTLTASGTGTAIELVGQTFVNYRGPGALSASSGRWLVWSGNPSDDTRNGLLYNFKQYNAHYGDDVPHTGNGFLYTLAPKVSYVLTGTVSREYNGTNSATLTDSNYLGTVTGAVDDDTVMLNHTADRYSATYSQLNTGSNLLVTVDETPTIAGTPLNGSAEVYGYQTRQATGNIGQIAQKAVTLIATKVYDGTKVLDAGEVTISTGVTINGVTETLSYSGATSQSKDVSSNGSNYVSGITLIDGTGGGLERNYRYVAGYDVDANKVSIEKASLTLTAPTVTKSYDGGSGYTTTPSDLTDLSGQLFGSDTVSGATIGYLDRNAGSDKAVTLGSVTISDGNGGNNYNLTLAGNSTSVIEKATLTLKAPTVTKSYDGESGYTTTSSDLTSLSRQLFGSDTVSGATIGYLDKNAGSNKAVTLGSVTVSDGNGGNNYDLTLAGNSTSVIDKATLTLTANSDARMYTAIPYSGGNGVTYAGFVNGEDSGVLGGSLTYGGSSQGAVLPGSYAIVPGGLSSGNYDVSYVDGTLTISTIESGSIWNANVKSNWSNPVPIPDALRVTYSLCD